MIDNLFTLSDVHAEVIHVADKYIKAVLINTKNRYFRTLRKLQQNGMVILELEQSKPSQLFEDYPFPIIDCEYYHFDDEIIELEKSDLTNAMQSLTPIQLEIFLQSVLRNKPQRELAIEHGLSKRMIQKHKYNAIKKLRTRLKNEVQR